MAMQYLYKIVIANKFERLINYDCCITILILMLIASVDVCAIIIIMLCCC